MKTNPKAIASVLTLVFAAFLVSTCSTSKNSTKNEKDKNIVGEVAGEPVTLSELEQNYQSSSPVQTLQQEDLSDFLPVYLNYKAKLNQAKEAGYYENPQIKKEYQNYAEQAAYSYWMNRVVVDSLLNQYERRRQTEVNASHILRRITGQASPSDTMEAYKTLMEARQKYLNGAPFDSLVQEYSTKQRGRPLGGEIGYFTGGNTLKSFEDAAFNLPPDSISMPVRTKYGYHLLLVHDKRDRNRDRKVSHIFFSVRNPSQMDTAKVQAQKAYNALKAGMRWDEAVMKFSQDRASKRKGGTIGWINYGRVDPALVDSIMAIDTADSYSEPIRSKYGYHILKVDSIRSFASDSAKRSFMMSKLKELPRYKNRKQFVHNRLEKIGGAQKFNTNLRSLSGHISSYDTTAINEITLSNSLADSPAYAINGDTSSVGVFYQWLQEKHGNTPATRYRARWFDDFKLNAVTEHLIPLTKKRFPEFSDKIKNYMDGLVVFQVTQDSVWNYAQTDTTRLRQIYRANPDSFQYGKRYHYTIFISESDSLLQKGVKGYKGGIPTDTLDKNIQGLAIRTDSTGYVEEFPFSKLKEMQPGQVSNLVKYRKQKAYLYLHEVLSPRRMTFDEAYNRLVSYYQPIREEEWIQSLRDTYDVQSYPERLQQLLTDEGNNQ